MSERVPIPHDRQYSEAEFVRILRTAAALQDADAPEGRQHGLTLAEIEQIAADVGIDAQHIATAAALVATQASEEWRHVLALPVRGSLARAVPGDLPDDAWANVVATIRRALGHDGQHGYVPGALEWTHSDGGSEIRVEVTRGEGVTHVQLAADHREAMALYLATAPVLGASVAVVPLVALGLGDVVEPWLFIAGGAGGGVVLGWIALRATCVRWQRRFRTLLQDLSDRPRSAAEQRASTMEQ